MRQFSYNRWLIVLIVVGLLSALAVDVQRSRVEQENMTVDLAIDYEGLVELAEREGLPVEEVLAQAKEAGLSSLAVYETTFKKLNVNGKVSAAAGSEILANYQNGAMSDPQWRTLVENGTIKGTQVYVTGHDAQTFREVKEDLLRRLGEQRVTSLWLNGQEILAVQANYESFLKMNLGMPTDEMQAVNKAGFSVIARPSNYNMASREDVLSVFARLQGINVSEMVFSGSQTLGAPKALQTTIDAMRERNMTLGMIEDTTQLQFYKQDGLDEIAQGLDYKAARLYSIPKDEQPKLKMDSAVERWSNTDEERNIRIDLLRIYEKPSPNMTLLETNMKYFRDTHDALTAKGFHIGPASTFAPYYPANVWRIPMVIGVSAAVVLYLSLICPAFRPKYQYILLAFLILGSVVPLALGNGTKIRLLAAFASANVFPALAVIWQLDRIRSSVLDAKSPLWRIICTGVLALLVSSLLSYIGAAYLSGTLADTKYFLEVDIFRGIKLTFVLPLILVALAFLQRFDIFDGRMDDTKGVAAQFKKIMDMPVKIKTLCALGVVVAAGIVFVARSGHTSGMPVSSLELRFRAFLEQAFYARPRSKELLIGHPAFMLAVMAVYRKWPTMLLFILVLLATIGQGSMVETFAHMRTPIFMSFMRGIGGIALGAGIGAILMILIHIWQRLLCLARQRGKGHE